MKKLIIFVFAVLGMLACTKTEHNEPDTPEVIKGALPGKFSVSSTKRVYFSQGNLQYRASTKTWRFAEKQYDMIGDDNASISASYTGWIDLFGWGTGNNPTSVDPDQGSDYSIFTDWGVNAITNGGNEPHMWRTLTEDEWVYLFKSRTNALSLYGRGIINGIRGMIVLPDDWSGKKHDIPFIPGNSSKFDDNTYSQKQWALLESEGAVFLPAAGERHGAEVEGGAYGNYWSSTKSGVYASYLAFGPYFLELPSYYERSSGHSVRLVR